ncbi:MAG: polysaccharide deacetylase family protein [Acidobacteriia bacterium]|nr:polysaccharide deacetylase family protein [Terriglobia bacterium]
MNHSEILRKLKSMFNPEAIAAMARFGIHETKAYGVSTPVLRRLAREIGLLFVFWACIITATLFGVAPGLDRSTGRATRRMMAVTFDDLPVATTTWTDTAAQTKITSNLVRTVVANKIPAIGFVIEKKLFQDEKRDEGRVALLQIWLDAGLELGNHTYSHADLHQTPLVDYEQDILRGSVVTSGLMQKKGMNLRYFRHPFLHTGRSLEIRLDLDAFLTSHGYRVAPVTIDNSDWIFARAYDRAVFEDDKGLTRRIVQAYIPYMERKFDYFERQSVALFGAEIRQVLLLHANRLNADHFEDLVRMMRKRGYGFITLDEALQDKAYRSVDTFTGRGGISWLHRWAISQGKNGPFFAGEPLTPEFVMKEAGVKAE